MKKMNFWVTDLLDQQIEEAMLRLGINCKAELFRMLAVNCIKDLKITAPAGIVRPPKATGSKPAPPLTKTEKIILHHLRNGSQSINELVRPTGLHVSTVSSVLMQLLLKNRVAQSGSQWTLEPNE